MSRYTYIRVEKSTAKAIKAEAVSKREMYDEIINRLLTDTGKLAVWNACTSRGKKGRCYHVKGDPCDCECHRKPGVK